MLYWGQLLHFYQPPIQTYEWLARITDESYRPLLRIFHEHPAARATFNVNAVLLDLFHEHGLGDVIEGIRDLVQRGQVEITGTGKYHPILPMLPVQEQARQIELDRDTKRRYLGPNVRSRGFFPPELAFTPAIAESVRLTGHEWMLLAGVAHPDGWPTRHVDRLQAPDGVLAVLYRDDILSNRVSFKNVDAAGFVADLTARVPGDGDAYVVTAMDAETYGHHIPGWERAFLGAVFAALAPVHVDRRARGFAPLARNDSVVGSADGAAAALATARAMVVDERQDGDGGGALPAENGVAMAQLSEIVEHFPAGPVVSPRPSSWSTSDDDVRAGNPLPLWFSLDNELHRLQWEHLGVAVELVRAAERAADNEVSRRFAGQARGRLDRAEHSCQWWWASRRPMWDINMIERGLTLQAETVVNAYAAIDASGIDTADKRAHFRQVVIARDLRSRIEDLFFTTR